MSKPLLISILCIAITWLLLVACEKKQNEFENAYAKVLEFSRDDELIQKLRKLDSLYPAEVKIKAKLGAGYLAKGERDVAGKYLVQAESLVKNHSRHNTDRATLFLIYNNLATLQFDTKDYQCALDYAERALACSTSLEKQRLRMFKARCLYLSGKKEEAYAIYNLGWQEHNTGQMTHDDLIYYSNQALKHKEPGRAIDIMELYQERFAYNNGLGAELARIFEEKNETVNALLATAMDWEYMSGMVLISRNEILLRLGKMEKDLRRQNVQEETENITASTGIMLIGALKEYFQENYRQAAELLRKIPPEAAGFHFFNYLLLACQLESGDDGNGLSRFGELEKYYKDFPAFYFHYWQGMKMINPDYTFTSARQILEHCILPAAYTPLAVQARLELGRLLGLSGAASHLLLLKPELDDLLTRAVKEHDFALLTPVLELLTTPANVYRQEAFVAMQRLIREYPALKVYLEEQRGTLAAEFQKPVRELLGT